MTTISIQGARLVVGFTAGSLPRVFVDRPEFMLKLGRLFIPVTISQKAAHKLSRHKGGGRLEGRLVEKDGRLCLTNAGFQLFPVGDNTNVELVGDRPNLGSSNL
jgi:hypothetical protein